MGEKIKRDNSVIYNPILNYLMLIKILFIFSVLLQLLYYMNEIWESDSENNLKLIDKLYLHYKMNKLSPI